MRKMATRIPTVLAAIAVLTFGLWSPVSPVAPAIAATGGTAVQRWQTSQAGDRLTAKSNLSFVADDSSKLPTIQVTPTRHYQAIDGFGGTFNESGWSVLSTLSQSARDSVMANFFNPNTGAGFTLTRTPIGSDDFSFTHYTYDDLGSGTDFGMSQFSINHDNQYLIPFIKAAQAQGGSFRIFASPWTAPAWLKDNNSLIGGGKVILPSTDARYYQAYATYFQKYVQAYASQGITIDSVGIQNEPQNPAAFESTIWTSGQMADFVANYLGPQFQNNSVGAGIRIYEHNRDTWSYPKEVLDNTATAPYVTGVNFHNYECTFGPTYCMTDNIDLFNDSHPGYSVWMSEHTNVGVPDPNNYLDGEMWGNEIVADMNHGMGGWIYWNLVLDQNGGPVSSLSAAQDPLVMVNTSTGAVYYLAKYWYLAHFSKFVRPGAYRIGADGGQVSDGLAFTAFKNPDGSEVVEVVNSNDTGKEIKVREDGNMFRVTVDAHSINTFKWGGPVNTYHVIAGGSQPAVTASGDHYSADAYYSGGGAATNVHAIDNTADDVLYQPERNGNFSYSFPVPNGRYQVILKFSENYWSGSGQRTFNVNLEGQQVLSNFDIYAAAGAKYKAVDKRFNTTVSDGNLSLQFSTVKDNAKVDAIAVVPLPNEGQAFKSLIAPSYLMAADYNTGGEGVAYHFSGPGGSDTSYRSDATNLETCTNDTRCGDDLGWLSSGDWVNYTVNVTTGGNYDLLFRVASQSGGGQFALDVDGANLVATQSVPSTGGWQNWTTVPAYGVTLSKGVHTFKFRVVSGGFNLHYVLLKNVTRLDVLPATLEAEAYAAGGEGEGYHDTATGNSFTSPYPGYLRGEDADLEISREHLYDLGNTSDGEWLRFDVWSPADRAYTVTFRVASSYSSGQIRLDLDSIGSTIGSTLSVSSTGDWQRWANLTETVTIPGGSHTLYVYIVKGGFNLNYVSLN